MYTIELITFAERGDLADLLEASMAEGFHHIQRLLDDLGSGENRFDQVGEGLWVVRCREGSIAGVVGLNRDPFAGDAGIGRVRRLYLVPEHRGKGAARLLMENLMRHAATTFTQLHVNVGPREARAFYEKLGFVAHQAQRCTHRLVLVAPSATEIKG